MHCLTLAATVYSKGMAHLLLLTLASSLALNLVMFLVAFRLRSDKLTDISYALSFLVINTIVLVSAPKLNSYSWLIFLLVAIWGIRLGSFLLIRIFSAGKDSRFDQSRDSFVKFGKFWLGQALLAWILMLPVTIALYSGGEVTALVVIGLAVWSVGFLTESLADYQKFSFRHDPANKNRWIEQGVWKYSRHPNYFGEISVWVGIYLASFVALSGVQRLICLISPLVITLLLLFVTGVPILEKSADKRWGHIKQYQDYKKRTRLLIPLPKVAQ